MKLESLYFQVLLLVILSPSFPHFVPANRCFSLVFLVRSSLPSLSPMFSSVGHHLVQVLLNNGINFKVHRRHRHLLLRQSLTQTSGRRATRKIQCSTYRVYQMYAHIYIYIATYIEGIRRSTNLKCKSPGSIEKENRPFIRFVENSATNEAFFRRIF